MDNVDNSVDNLRIKARTCVKQFWLREKVQLWIMGVKHINPDLVRVNVVGNM